MTAGRYLHLPEPAVEQPPSWVGQYTHPTTQTAPDAARYVRLFLSGRMLPVGTVDLAGLAAFHLVENAVQHGDPTIRVAVALDADGIRLDVHDTGTTREFGPDRYGLAMVRAIAGDYTITPDHVGSGKTVTAVVPYERKR